MIPRPPEAPSDGLRLGIRADGGPGIGAGHLARCLALAQAWKDLGGSVVLASADPPEAWAAAYRAEGAQVVGPADGEADAWVVDGYDLTLPGERAPWLRIDDGGRSGDRGAALVLDQNLGATAADYPGEGRGLLLGPRFALLRRPLAAAAASHADAPLLDRPPVLLAAGGAPAPEVAAAFAQVAERLRAEGLEVVAWSGADDPLPALRHCGAALAASGSTVWELCAFGIAAVVVAVAANQQPIARAVGQAGVAVDAGGLLGTACDPTPESLADLVVALVVDRARRQEVAGRARALVDGQGAARVALALRDLARGAEPLTIARTATT